MGQPSQNGPLTDQPFRSLLIDMMNAPFVVPTSIVTPSWFIALGLRCLDHALSQMFARVRRPLCARARDCSRKADLHRLRIVPYRPIKAEHFEVITRRYKEWSHIFVAKSPSCSRFH